MDIREHLANLHRNETAPAELARLKEFMRNAAAKIDVLAINAGAHGARETQIRLHAIASLIRERVI